VDEKGSETLTHERANRRFVAAPHDARIFWNQQGCLLSNLAFPSLVAPLKLGRMQRCRRVFNVFSWPHAGKATLACRYISVYARILLCKSGAVVSLKRRESRLQGSRRDAFRARSNQSFFPSLSGYYSEAPFYAGLVCRLRNSAANIQILRGRGRFPLLTYSILTNPLTLSCKRFALTNPRPPVQPSTCDSSPQVNIPRSSAARGPSPGCASAWMTRS
jgi:hypothetical protein